MAHEPDHDETPTAPPAQRRWWPWAFAGLVVLTGGIGFYEFGPRPFGRGGDQAQTAQSGKDAAQGGKAAPQGKGGGGPVPVKVAEAKKQDVPLFKTALGAVQAFNTVEVKSRVDGQIESILFTEGQTVHAGDVLARIDPRPYQATYDQAVAKKTQDASQRANAQVDLARYQQLSQREFASRQQLDTQAATVEGLTAQLAGDQAQIDSAKTQLDYTTIRAPITGRTGFRLVDQGNVVHASDQTGIVTITQVQPIAAVFTLPESDLRDISASQARGTVPVSVLAQDGRSEAETGHLLLLDNAVDQSTGSIKLKAEFLNDDNGLWPGQSATVEVHYDTLKEALTVPADAVERSQQGLFVYVVKEDMTADMRPVTVGVISRGIAVIEKGVELGERVVVSGQYRLVKGAKVSLAQDGKPEKTADAGGDSASPVKGTK